MAKQTKQFEVVFTFQNSGDFTLAMDLLNEATDQVRFSGPFSTRNPDADTPNAELFERKIDWLLTRVSYAERESRVYYLMFEILKTVGLVKEEDYDAAESLVDRANQNPDTSLLQIKDFRADLEKQLDSLELEGDDDV